MRFAPLSCLRHGVATLALGIILSGPAFGAGPPADGPTQQRPPVTQPSKPPAPSNEPLTNSLFNSGGVYQIHARLNGAYNVKFVLDSGAADIHLSGKLFKRMVADGSITKADMREVQTYVIADGTRVQSRTFVLKSVQVGTYTVNNVLASVGADDDDETMLLGMTFLGQFKSITIDNQTKTLLLN